MTIEFQRIIPVLRIFDAEKAKEFYLGYLGFHLDWEHRFEPGMPVYMQVSRGPIVLHLSEHHGDGCPGANLTIETAGVEELHAEVSSRGYRSLRPGVVNDEFGKHLSTIDPFHNRLRFTERRTA